MLSKVLFYAVLKPISLLPYWVLYRVSDFFYILFITVFTYRKKVVLKNIQQSFPERLEREHRAIMRGFYRHLADVFMETFKNFSISEADVHRRMKCTNPELLDEVAAKGQDIVLCGGHYNNWELYALAAPAHFSGRSMAIYKRIKDPWFDKKMRETRGKFGLELVPTLEASEWMKSNAGEKIVSVYAIDQSPANPKKAHWFTFLGQPTAAYYGAEKHARQYNMAVVYGHIYKKRRGFYELTYELVTDDVASWPSGGVIEAVNRILEKDILQAPQYWLWSHKRWKHHPPKGIAVNP